MLDSAIAVAPDTYPFYEPGNAHLSIERERAAPAPASEDATTLSNYKLSRASSPQPSTVIPLRTNGKFPVSAIPMIPQAVTNRAGTIYYKLYVESDLVLSYDVVAAPQPSMEVTNRAGTIIYKLYIEDDGAISYDVVPYSPALVYVTNRAGTKIYQFFVEDDGAISYDLI